MIKDKKAKALLVDFSTLASKGYPCADIDAVHIVNKYVDKDLGGFTVFIETKYELGYFTNGQKFIYEHLCRNLACGGATIFATHNKTWQDGYDQVDLANCQVREIFWNGQWHGRDYGETVAEVMTKMLGYERMRRHEEKLQEIQKSQSH